MFFSTFRFFQQNLYNVNGCCAPTNNTHKMVDTQHFCLRWNNYQSSITSAFENLRDDEDFVDVTLACDGRSLKAHRVVLSACSPYFRELLKVSVHTAKAQRNRWDSKSVECILCSTSFLIAERLKWLQFRKRLCGYQEKAIMPKRTGNGRNSHVLAFWYLNSVSPPKCPKHIYTAAVKGHSLPKTCNATVEQRCTGIGVI